MTICFSIAQNQVRLDDWREAIALLDHGQNSRTGIRGRLGALTSNFPLDLWFRSQVRGVEAGGLEGAARTGVAGNDSLAEFAAWLGEHAE